MNEGVKNMLLSKTIWGALIAVIATVLKLAGIDIGDTDGWANDIVALFGASFAIYGRIVATKKIKT